MGTNLYDEVKKRRDFVSQLRDPAQDDRDYEEYKKQDNEDYWVYREKPENEEQDKNKVFNLVGFISCEKDIVRLYNPSVNRVHYVARAATFEDQLAITLSYLRIMRDQGYTMNVTWVSLD